MNWIRKRIRRARYLWRAALKENASPHKFALSVALGVFFAASAVPPIFGLRTACATFVAWIAKLNRLTTALSIHLLFGPLAIVVIVAEVALGSRIIHRASPAWGPDPIDIARQASHVFLAWLLGSLVIAPACAVVAYAIARPIARRYLSRNVPAP